MLRFRIEPYFYAFAFAASVFLATPEAAAGYLVNTYESSSKLYSVNPDTGSSTLIGPTGIAFQTDLASAANGSLFGSSLTSLYSINPTTASSSLIGAFGTSTSMVGLTFASNGILYGVAQSGGGIFSINTTSGLANLLFSTPFSYDGDVAYSTGNIFYATADLSGVSHLIQINTGSFATVDLGVIASGKTFPGLDFDQTGRLIAFASDGSVYNIPSYTSSGSGVFLSNTGLPVGGATFSSVPEPTSLVILGIGIASVLGLARHHFIQTTQRTTMNWRSQ